MFVKRGKQALERRQCPQCASLVAINKLRCCCGYSFKIIDAYNRRKECTAKVRATETSKAATQRKKQNKEHMANARAIEPVEVVAQRKQQHREHMANARAIEPVEVATQRKQKNREHMANARAIEPVEVAVQRKQQHREHIANARAIEPIEVAAQRKQQHKEHMANARAIETSEASQNRNSQNAVSMRACRNRTLTIDETISEFLSKIRVGPEYVCTVCHRMMYSSNVVPFNRHKYTKGSPKMLDSVFSVMYVCPDGSQWICRVAFSLPVPTEMAILKGAVHVTDTPTSRG